MFSGLIRVEYGSLMQIVDPLLKMCQMLVTIQCISVDVSTILSF